MSTGERRNSSCECRFMASGKVRKTSATALAGSDCHRRIRRWQHLPVARATCAPRHSANAACAALNWATPLGCWQRKDTKPPEASRSVIGAALHHRADNSVITSMVAGEED